MTAVLIAVATGKQGGSLIRSLVSRNAPFEILAVTRNPASASAQKLKALSSSIKLVEGDLDNPTGIFQKAHVPEQFHGRCIRDEEVDRQHEKRYNHLGGRANIKEIAASFEKFYGVKPSLESRESLDDLYKTMHEKRAQSPMDIYGYMSMFFYYYWVSGQTLLSTDLDNERYDEVKPVSWEGFMAQYPLETLSSAFFALSG
ncbi:nmrA-like family protein [Aspergillus affinis]|uniref:nmrA-like family protein n=1 Tax=Aspergillus affinis TaxID=1070780 RepID=UPI0022FDC3E8|nr:nmrA-like family protein [Aspergillus affinis]KAI9043064.1 nmrA-like family protein [Aspergillus affinis]